MQRDSWDDTYMKMCEVLARRSTCIRVQTAALIVKNNVIISVGYNGVFTGEEHCCDYWPRFFASSSTCAEGVTLEDWMQTGSFYQLHHGWSCTREIHGEMNAILFAGRNGIPIVGSTLYTILAPCIRCAGAICVAGVDRVVYRDDYARDTDGVNYLRVNGVAINKYGNR